MTDTPKVYPASDLDIPAKFQGQTGSFWSRDFKDRATLNSVASGRLRAFDQTQDFANEVEKLVSRFTAPVMHRERWIPLQFTLDASGVSVSSPLKYGADKALYGEAGDNPPYDRVFKYGQNLLDGATRALPLPEGVTNIRALMNRVTNPSLTLVEGVDFQLLMDDGVIATSIDIFNDPRVSVLNSNSANGTDKRVKLWAYGIEYDRDYMWQHFGYVVGTRAPSSKGYKNLVNSIWDAHVAATNKGAIYRLLSAVMDVPYALEAGETVEQILTGKRVQIITDKHVYDIADGANIVVAVGDTLTQYQGLTDTVSVQDLRYIDDGLELYGQSIEPLQALSSAISGSQGIDGIVEVTTATGGARQVRQSKGAGVDNLAYFDDPDSESVASPTTIAAAAVPYRFEYYTSYNSISLSYQNATQDIGTANGLGTHKQLRVKYKFLAIGGWRGNEGPATVSTLVDGVVVNTTTISTFNSISQAYPDSVGVSNPAFTGATRIATDIKEVWHPWHSGQPSDGTAEYTIDLVVPHTAPSATVAIAVTGLEEDMWTVVNRAPIRRDVLDISTGEDFYGTGQATDIVLYKGMYTATEFESKYGFPPDGFGTIGDGDGWYPTNAWRAADVSITPAVTATRVKLPWLNPAQVDNPDVPGITLTGNFLATEYFEGLFLANKEVDLEYVGVDANGYVDVRFEVSGYPGDVTQFWELAYERGKAQGYTLADYLDQRANPIGPPEPRHLPEKVNPMLLVLRHIMGYNLFIIKLRVGLEGKNALDPAFLGTLRKVLPPHTAFIIFTEINVTTQEFDEPHYETIAIGGGPVITEVDGLTIDLRPPAVTGVQTYI